MSMRHSVAPSPSEASLRAFADDVAYYLTQTPRQLPSRYLYDELGSSLFEAICRLPWYRIAKTEQSLLSVHAGAIFGRLQPISTVVELGPGSGEKLITLMAALPDRDVTVHLVGVSPAALGAAATALAASSSLTVVAHQATYEAGMAAIGRSNGAASRTLVVLGAACRAGLEALGLATLTAPDCRAATLSVMRLPEGVDDAAFRREAYRRGVTLAGGLGPIAGKAFRVGHMGNIGVAEIAATLETVEASFATVGVKVPRGAALAAAAPLLAGEGA